MIPDIQNAYQTLRLAVATFNQEWPELVVSATVWRLPVLTEQKTPDTILVERLDGHAAVLAAREELLTFERDLGQAPGTVSRLPGLIVVRESVLNQVLQLNALKDNLKSSIEQTRIELGQVPAARPRIMRKALGNTFNTNQLLRHIQAFDGAPRLVVFTWAGHTGGSEYKAVGQIREQLLMQAEARAAREHIPIEETPESMELRSLALMSDDESLVKRKLVAPHPRAMFYFSESTRYEAMIHANLPAFVIAGDGECEVRGLKNFNRSERSAQRPDQKNRIEALPGKDLFLPTKTKGRAVERRELNVPATYGKQDSSS
jgi:hypothetical protein